MIRKRQPQKGAEIVNPYDVKEDVSRAGVLRLSLAQRAIIALVRCSVFLGVFPSTRHRWHG